MKYNPSTIALVLLLLVVALYLGAISPLSASLEKARATLSREELNLTATRVAITQSPDIKARIAELEATNALNRAQLLTPLLSSYAMRAKSLLAPIAFETGLTGVEYEEGGYRALPIPRDRLPSLRTGRHTVRLRALADYAALASFVLRAEKDLPRMTVQSLTITPNKDPKAEQQEVELILEWPCEGEVIK